MAVEHMLDHIAHHISELGEDLDKKNRLTDVVGKQDDKPRRSVNQVNDKTYCLLTELKAVQKRFALVHTPTSYTPTCVGADTMPKRQEMQQAILETLEGGTIDLIQLQTVVTTFMHLVKAQYEEQIQNHVMVLDVSEAEVLMESVQSNMQNHAYDVEDLKTLCPQINFQQMENSSPDDTLSITFSKSNIDDLNVDAKKGGKKRNKACAKVAESMIFDVVIMLVIIVNAIAILIETRFETYYMENKNDFFLLEIFFTLCYTAEFIVKISYQCFDYFKDTWNIFDLVLLITGYIGIYFQYQTLPGERSDISELSGSARINRILKAVRLVRLIRMFRLFRSYFTAVARGKMISIEVATAMQHTNLLECFISAHIHAQANLLEYMCSRNSDSTGKGKRKPESAEVARVLLQSEVSIYKALIICSHERKKVHESLFDLMATCKRSYMIGSSLETMIMDASSNGILSMAEATKILHPMHHHMAVYMQKMHALRLGMAVHDVSDDEDDHHEDGTALLKDKNKGHFEEPVPEPTDKKRDSNTLHYV